MANVRARFYRFREAYQQGRITKEQLEKVQSWAKAKDASARIGFEQFRKKAATQLV